MIFTSFLTSLGISAQTAINPALAALWERSHLPVADFGKVWREETGVRDRLGWATEPESPSPGEIQPLERGEMIWRESESRIRVLYGDTFRGPSGDWGVHERAFD